MYLLLWWWPIWSEGLGIEFSVVRPTVTFPSVVSPTVTFPPVVAATVTLE